MTKDARDNIRNVAKTFRNSKDVLENSYKPISGPRSAFFWSASFSNFLDLTNEFLDPVRLNSVTNTHVDVLGRYTEHCENF